MKISQPGLDAIKAHEGLRLTAYPDPASGGDPWTIGYGHTRDVQRGQTITPEQAEQFLRDDLAWVETCIARTVTVPLSQGQYDALCSLIFNIGAGAFGKSTLLRKLNSGDASAADEFLRWDKAAGKSMPGLARRRAAERAMFLSQPIPEPDMPIPAIVAAVLPSIVSSIPTLAKLFGSGSEVSERNTKAAEIAVGIVADAVGARNAQEAAEIIAADPVAAKVAGAAISARWLELTEAGGGGIEGARTADVAAAAAGNMLQSPSFWVALALLPLVYLVVGSVIGLWGGEWPSDVRAAIATAVVSLIVGGIMGYYYGQTTSRNRTA